MLYNIAELRRSLIEELIDIVGGSRREVAFEVDVILEHLAKLPQEEMLLVDDIDIDTQALWSTIAQRKQGRPLAYILGESYFYGRKIAVNESVLIPRPETELLVEKSLELICQNQLSDIVEIGIGSGCISVSIALELLAREYTNFHILATDISLEALEIAQQNIAKYDLTKYIVLQQADIVEGDIDCDILLSNPPYITFDEYRELDRDVQNEPYTALVGDTSNITGLIVYEKIWRKKIQAKYMLLEIDPNRVKEIQGIYQSQYRITVIKDYNDYDRFLLGKNIN